MLLAFAAILLGFIIMMYSADWFVQGAASLADLWGMSKLMIGLTIVAFGTSAPEIIVSLMAALNGSAALAVGNALGSNLANVGLVIGLTALIAPLAVNKSLIRSELPVLILVYLIAGYTLFDQTITWLDSAILLTTLIAFIFYLYFKQRSDHKIDHPEEEDEVGELIGLSLSKACFYLVGGLLLLLASAEILVWGAIQLAKSIGVPELIIGLTIVAVGTSLPELAASVASAKRGHYEIAFGNVIGSNTFNLLVVMAMPGLVGTQTLSKDVFSRDYTAMILISGLWMAFMSVCYLRKNTFNRWMGTALLLSYAAYYVLLAGHIAA